MSNETGESGREESEGEFSSSTGSGLSVADRVFDLLAPVVATADAELLDVEWTGGTLRVVIEGKDGVTTDVLTKVNRLVSPILDQHDPVPGRYTLEVSSPGVERPLRRVEHYQRAVGENIIVKMMPHMTYRRIRGNLVSIEQESLAVEVVEIDGVELAESESHTVGLQDINTARTIFEWGPTPKKGGKNPKKAPPKKKPQLNTATKETDLS